MTQLAPTRCKIADYVRTEFVVTPEAGTPFEALLAEHYWAHCSLNFRPGSKLEVHPPEGHYYAELIVQDCGRLFAKVAVLNKVNLHAVEVGVDAGPQAYSVKYCGPNALWCVHRKVDGALIKSELGTKDAALEWAKQHSASMGRAAA